MHLFRIFLLSIAMLLLPQTGFALSVGVVDAQILLKQSPQRVEAEKKLQAEFEPIQQALNKKQQALKDAATQLEKQRLTLKAAEITNKERELQLMQSDIQREAQQAQQSFQARQQQENQLVTEAINAAIEKISKQKSLDLVLFKGAIAWQKETATENLTDAVLEMLSPKKP